MSVDLKRILSIDHACRGCASAKACCCARYEACVTAAEMKRIVRVLPEAAKYCPQLKNGKEYANVFEETDSGLFAMDTTDDGLCVFAFKSGNVIRCSLHAAALKLGLSLEKVKPKPCILWPMGYSEGDEMLSVVHDAFSFPCNRRRRKPSRRISPALDEAIGMVYGEAFRERLNKTTSNTKPPRRQVRL